MKDIRVASALLALTLAAGCTGGVSGPTAGGGGASGGGASGSGADGAAGADGGADAGGACPTGGEGQLLINVVLPIGTTLMPQLRVLGPLLNPPEAVTLGAPQAVPAGPGYVIEAHRVKVAPPAGGIVGQAYFAQRIDFDGCIKANELNVATVTYAREPGSARLWMTVTNAGLDRTAVAYDGTSLATSGARAPTVTLTGGPSEPQQPAFDATGNLWIPGGGTPGKIVMFKTERLGAALSGPPDVEVTGGAVVPAQALAFDANGDLWVARRQAGEVVRLPSAALTTSGAKAPDAVVKSPDLMGPSALAFDKDGSLWVADEDGSKVVRFATDRLVISYTGPVDAVLNAVRLADTGAISYEYRNPRSLAFDRGGNLWVGYLAGNNIVRFSPADLPGDVQVGNPLEIVAAGGALVTGLAFDEMGGLWYPASPGKLARLPPAALTGLSGLMNATPDIVIDGAGEVGSIASLAFDPAPAALPLHDN